MRVKYCWCCNQWTDPDYFGKDASQKDGLARFCKECGRAMWHQRKDRKPNKASARTLRHRARNKDAFERYRNDVRVKTKAAMADGYGGKCTCCGEPTLEFLTLEHLDRDGKDHRKAKHSSFATYKDVIDKGFPDNYTVLCLNCNHARRYGKECPHKTIGDMGKRAVTMGQLVEALGKCVSELERNTCLHEDTHRAGAIWEICDSCGRKWADDEGGKPEVTENPVVESCRTLLAQLEAEKGGE